MHNNETGEFELVVGNRQLLSGFFVVVLLFAVAFAMGYVVGQNSRLPRTQAEAAPPAGRPAEQRPLPTSAAAPAPQGAAPAAGEKEAAGAESAAPGPAQPTTQPVREPEPARTEPVREPERPRAEAGGGAGDPAPGAYWQVIATANRESAQMIVQSLKDKGFPAATSPGPNNLTRVLVGPYSDNTAMGHAKTELESSGFNRLVTFKK